MAPHHIPLAGGWAAWKWIWLRSAGFSAAQPLELAAPDLTVQIDALLDAGQAVATAQAETAQLVSREIDRASGDVRSALIQLYRKVSRGQPVEAAPTAPAAVQQALEALRARRADVQAREQAAQQLVEQEYARLSEIFRRLAVEPRLREAILWQNRQGLLTSAGAVLRNQGRADSKLRQKERFFASYLQRYCTKNDTIGFFGPVAWAEVDEQTPRGIELQHGPSMLAKRTVYLEHWAVDALAETLARDPEVSPHLSPRRVPTIRLEGTTVHHLRGSLELPEPFAALLEACDGETPARAIAARLIARGDLELDEPDQVYEMLDQLVAKQLAIWSFELPVDTSAPEAALLRQIDRIADDQVRARARARVEALLAARDAVAEAAGDPDRLEPALRALDDRFRELTGADSTRKHGEAYAGRTLAFEDCLLDASCRVSPSVLTSIADPLALVLQSARWFTCDIARRCLAIVTESFERLAGGGEAVPYLQLWEAIGPQITAEAGPPAIVSEAVDELQRRWAELLLAGVPDSTRRVERTAAELAAAVHAAFPAERPGWPQARFHSPDVMIAAPSLEALRADQYTVVMGELHVAVNSLLSKPALSQRDDVEPLFRASQADLPATLLAPVESKRFATRADLVAPKPGDFQLELGVTRSSLPRERVIAVADLVVVRDGASLALRTIDGRHRFALLDLLGAYLSFASVSAFRILPSRVHTPRISIGRLVLERERWTFDAAALPFRESNDPVARFAGARRWAREHGLPRFVFAKVHEEPKPYYVDLASPMYVDILAARMRSASRVTISEMLPGPDQLWLRDAAGQAYTSELRIAIVDPEP